MKRGRREALATQLITERLWKSTGTLSRSQRTSGPVWPGAGPSLRHPSSAISPAMLALTDDQLAIVMTAAGGLPVEKRGLFLERVGGTADAARPLQRHRPRRRGARGAARTDSGVSRLVTSSLLWPGAGPSTRRRSFCRNSSGSFGDVGGDAPGSL